MLGDGDLGPDWINSRAPFHGDPWRADHTEAYVHLSDGCAACVAGLEGQVSPIWHALHSIREEEDFVDVFNALHNATELRSQVIADLQPPFFHQSFLNALVRDTFASNFEMYEVMLESICAFISWAVWSSLPPL